MRINKGRTTRLVDKEEVRPVHLGLCVIFGLTDEITALDSTPFLHQSGMEVHETA